MNEFSLIRARDLNPLPIVTEIPLFCLPGTRVLDVGVGTGRNSLFLARYGCRVDAIDCSAEGIGEINAYAKAHALPLHAMVHDISERDPPLGGYQVILCTLALHYLAPDRANSLLANARRLATSGTLHVIGAITTAGDFSRQHSPGELFFPNPDELLRTYTDEGWMVHRAYSEELKMLKTNADGDPMRNVVSFILAQKAAG
ncbi:MAG TPA: methyltransferase domain-containing protein [Humisphaera sp.]|nr:methyltransferase domain-containing protein [Humisphaera sp.]